MNIKAVCIGLDAYCIANLRNKFFLVPQPFFYTVLICITDCCVKMITAQDLNPLSQPVSYKQNIDIGYDLL